jgi:hypothetical protein
MCPDVPDRWLGPAPAGVFGELYIGGVGLQGNAGAPALTAASFIPDPFGSGDRLCRTGDLARWREDGVLEVVDGDRPGQAVVEDAPAARAYEAPRTLVEEGRPRPSGSPCRGGFSVPRRPHVQAPNGGEGLEVNHLAGIFRRDDEAEVMPVI